MFFLKRASSALSMKMPEFLVVLLDSFYRQGFVSPDLLVGISRNYANMRAHLNMTLIARRQQLLWAEVSYCMDLSLVRWLKFLNLIR